VSPAARGGTGKNAGIVTFRDALEALIESLDATVRIARWEPGGEAIPDPLRLSAEQLQTRLGSATRLAAGRFVGTPAAVVTSDAIRNAVQQLDAAFVAYRKRLAGGAGQQGEAAIELDAEVGRVKLDAHRWG
jgi:hypothetical protein